MRNAISLGGGREQHGCGHLPERKVAGYLPSLGNGCERRPLDPAAVLGDGAARMEAAAVRRVDRARHVARQHDALARPRCVEHRAPAPRRSAPGYRDGLGLAKMSSAAPSLDDRAQIHDRDARRDLAHHAQIMGDEDIGEVEPLLQIGQQVDDLRLHRDIERRDRLVERRSARARARSPGRCRCAGAGRRRIRAGSAPRGRAEARRARAARRTRSRISVSLELADERAAARRSGRAPAAAD